ncbi:TPA: MAE_28990/MAE_18760 family HEPN-like nuclease [Elizabethkingia anophelis]
MSSFVNEGLELLVERISEINLLLNEAEARQENTHLYAALCRSIQVLSISHFEGYIKDLVKNILDDINQGSSFKQSSNDLKFSYCRKFVVPLIDGKDNITKIKDLILVFDELDTKFDSAAFHKPNKNPKESILNQIAISFGEKRIFKKLNNSDIANAFSNTDYENLILVGELKMKLQDAIKDYPYIEDDTILNIHSTEVQDTFWETFIQEILSERHKIAHGNMNNSTDHNSIRSNILKMEILLISITYLLALKGNPILLHN